MEPNWAAEHLQVIRTLMERSALYRRALAPIMIYAGVLGLFAAAAGWAFNISKPPSFILYWFAIGVAAVTGAFLMVRRQAWQHDEPLWSPPTRRVALSICPPLTAGFILGLLAILGTPVERAQSELPPDFYVLVWIPVVWTVLYGCAIHAAGFFMRRGIRLFAWIFILGPWATLFCPAAEGNPSVVHLGHATMGVFFGIVHLAYGVYLYFTEHHGNEA